MRLRGRPIQVEVNSMPLLRSNTADKNHCGPQETASQQRCGARGAQDARPSSQQAGNPTFDRELLKLHARAMVGSATAIPLLVLSIGAAGLFAGMGTEILVWALITLTCYAGAGLRRAARRPHRRRRHRRRGHAPQFPDRAFRQRARLDLFRLARLRRLPGRPVPCRQGGGAAAGHGGDRADRLVAARRAARHLRPAGGASMPMPASRLWMPVEAIMVGAAGRVAAVLRLRRRPSQPFVADAACRSAPKRTR